MAVGSRELLLAGALRWPRYLQTPLQTHPKVPFPKKWKNDSAIREKLLYVFTWAMLYYYFQGFRMIHVPSTGKCYPGSTVCVLIFHCEIPRLQLFWQ